MVPNTSVVVADTCAVMCTDGIEAGIMSGSRAYIVHVHGIHHTCCFAGQCHLALVMIFLVLADVLVTCAGGFSCAAGGGYTAGL